MYRSISVSYTHLDVYKRQVPVSGTELSRQCAVSRQIIVQDISWLRAAGYQILSTTKGYLLQNKPACTREYRVQHSDAQIEDELNTIVDLGGTVQLSLIHIFNPTLYWAAASPCSASSVNNCNAVV